MIEENGIAMVVDTESAPVTIEDGEREGEGEGERERERKRKGKEEEEEEEEEHTLVEAIKPTASEVAEERETEAEKEAEQEKGEIDARSGAVPAPVRPEEPLSRGSLRGSLASSSSPSLPQVRSRSGSRQSNSRGGVGQIRASSTTQLLRVGSRGSERAQNSTSSLVKLSRSQESLKAMSSVYSLTSRSRRRESAKKADSAGGLVSKSRESLKASKEKPGDKDRAIVSTKKAAVMGRDEGGEEESADSEEKQANRGEPCHSEGGAGGVVSEVDRGETKQVPGEEEMEKREPGTAGKRVKEEEQNREDGQNGPPQGATVEELENGGSKMDISPDLETAVCPPPLPTPTGSKSSQRGRGTRIKLTSSKQGRHSTPSEEGGDSKSRRRPSQESMKMEIDQQTGQSESSIMEALAQSERAEQRRGRAREGEQQGGDGAREGSEGNVSRRA